MNCARPLWRRGECCFEGPHQVPRGRVDGVLECGTPDQGVPKGFDLLLNFLTQRGSSFLLMPGVRFTPQPRLGSETRDAFVTERLRIGLLENAVDYVLSAAEHTRNSTPRALKYALLHLVAGVELILKARLLREHWSLLFADVDKAALGALESGDFRSIGFESACERLRGVAAVEIERSTLDYLDRLRKLRNQLQHFAIDVDLDSVKSVVARGLDFVLDFRARHLADASVDQRVLDEIYEHLQEFKEFVNHRMTAIEPQLKAAPDLLDCPRCFQRTMIVGDASPRCAFCGLEVAPDVLASQISEGGEPEECPNCGAGSCVMVVYDNDTAGWVCTSCAVRGDYSRCPRCGRLSDTDDLCFDCAQRMLHD